MAEERTEMISDQHISMITMDAEDEAEMNDGEFTMTLVDYKELLTRLEAAEKVCEEVKMGDNIDWDSFNQTYASWCQTAGK
jgi:hypothetical protein